MSSTKKQDLKQCNKCNTDLNDENWKNYDKNNGRYICNLCRKNTDKQYYLTNPEYKKKQVARYRSRKSAIIHSYGDACAFCGENDYYKLTIDHKFGNGNNHRKEISNHMYDWLYNNPVHMDGYQVLCYNCNCSKNVLYKDKYALRDKTKVIEAYGKICKECGEDRIERLTIDHKNNDGAAQRKQLKCSTGVRMYRWLIKNNFPKELGLQVLCFNCNCCKRSAAKFETENPDQTVAGFNA